MSRNGKTKFQRELKNVQDVQKFEKDYVVVMSTLMSMSFKLRVILAMRLIFKGKTVKVKE